LPSSIRPINARAEIIGIDGHRFYKKPISIEADMLPTLRDLCASQSHYEPYEAKACGKFHPDWCLVWTRGGESVNFHLCFGCHDLEACAQGKLLVYCCIALEPFAEALDKLQTNRPESTLTAH
jgi:hypothetical protein